MRIISISSFCISVVLLFVSSYGCKASDCQPGNMVKYQPVFRNEYSKPGEAPYIVNLKKVTSNHYDNIKIVLDFYKIKYEILGGDILVECSVISDNEYVANLTAKAESKEWLADHSKKLN